MQQGPWAKYGGAQSAPSLVPLAPPDPMKARDQELQEEAAARAREDQQFQREKFGVEMQLKERELAKKDQPPKDPKVTEGERTGAGFYRRAVNAHKQYGEGILPRNPVMQGLVDVLPENWENQIDGPERRAAKNYADEFIRAKLRKESGAAISIPEMESEYRIYFPIPGDTREDLDRKAGLREQAIEGLRLGAGSEAPGALEGLPTDKPTGIRLSGEQEQELLNLLRTQGFDAADAYIQRVTGGKHKLDPTQRDKTGAEAIDYSTADAQREARLRQELERNPAMQGSDQELLGLQGATLGLSDEASGIGRGLSYLVTGQNPAEGYRLGRDAHRLALSDARQNLGAGGVALEIGGGLASGNVSNALSAAPSLLGRMGQGAKAGAAGGAIAGYGYGEGVNSLLTAGAGAAGGAALGAAIPVAGQVGRGMAQDVRRLTGRDPNLPRNIVGNAIEADGLTPAQVGSRMDDAHSRGSPMMIADTGENARQLLSSVGRQPGPSRAITKAAVVDRQHAQAERIGEAVHRDLGPTANIREMGDELIERARAASKPHYEAFENAPGASVMKFDDLAGRPAFQRALKGAIDLSLEEGSDPRAIGFRFNEAGEMMLDNEAISWRAMDYMKRALDDVIEKGKDQRGQLTEAGRAALGTKKTLVARMDKINSAYAKARAAYAGPAQMRDALELGAKSLNKSPDDIMALMKGMGDSEQDAFRLGVRKAISDLVATRKDGGDKVSLLLGTPKSRAVLSRVFGGKAEFERFIKTLRDEEAMGHTYKAVAGNSMTAERQADDALNSDSGLANAIVGGVTSGNPADIIARAWTKLQSVGQFGAGEAGKRTRESVAALLTETDPATLRELIRAAQSAAARQRAVDAKRGKNVVRAGRNAGNLTGMGLGRLQQPQER